MRLIYIMLILMLIAVPAAVADDVIAEDPGKLPGEFGYTFKTWGEHLRLMFTFNEQHRLMYQIKFAERRLVEGVMLEMVNESDRATEAFARYDADIGKLLYRVNQSDSAQLQEHFQNRLQTQQQYLTQARQQMQTQNRNIESRIDLTMKAQEVSSKFGQRGGK